MFGPGGPAAHIGLFEKIICQQLKWLPQHVFLELFALAQCLPGPASTQVLCTCRPVQYADCVSQDEQLRSRHDACRCSTEPCLLWRLVAWNDEYKTTLSRPII